MDNKSNKKWYLGVGLCALTGLVLMFQNCSPYSATGGSSSSNGDNTPLAEDGTQPVDQTLPIVGEPIEEATVIVKPAAYATGTLINSSEMANEATVFETNSTEITTRFQSVGFGDFAFATNEYGTWTLIGGVSERVVSDWNMTTTISATPPLMRNTYDFGSRQARVDAEKAIGNANFLTGNDYNATYFYVPAAYPEVIYGVKNTEAEGELRTESPNIAELPLPATLGNLPDFVIDYDFATEATQVEGNLYNVQNVAHYQERNVAIESFFHNDCSGNDINPANEVYELMLWFDKGPERGPSSLNGYGGDVTIDGRVYEVWSKDRGGKGYLAFVDKSPATATSGTINWSLFVNWAKTYGHRVSEVFAKPALHNSPPLTDDVCMSNILFGNEIWWGSGDFQLNRWDISAFEKTP